MDIDGLKELVGQSCDCIGGIAAVYLFGSRAKGRPNPRDYDFAVLFDETLVGDRCEQDLIVDGIQSALARALGKVDVVRMNDTDLVLTQQVMRYKVLVYCRSRAYKAEWETQARYRIWDMEPIHNRYRDAVFRRIEEVAREIDRPKSGGEVASRAE